MTIEQPASEFFTAGGTLPPDAPSYVKRPTDNELFRHIMNGDFCYILTPRQMGKSSLMIRTAQRLQSEGIRSAIVDLTVTGTVESEDQWYKGILTQIKRRLRINMDPVDWWEQRKDIPNIQKFVEFFEEVLTEVKERVVIFMDEIDTTLKLDFRDDFFAGIRAIFNDRARNPDLKRLTFVLLGVASPSDLIKDRSRTPFNVGQEIPLRPFSRQDARMFETGLEVIYPNSGKKILDRVFYWTNGHPYLTQKLCQGIVEARLEKYEDKEVDLLVKNLFTSDEASRETNLQFVRDNVLSYPERRVILSLYKKLLRGVEVRDNKNSLSQNHLKLSGLARAEDGRLVVSNKIYSQVFNQRWVNRYTEIDWRYFIIGALSLLVIGFAVVFYHDGAWLPNQAARMVNDVLLHKDKHGIQSLANLFRMKPYIFANEYEYTAKDTFFNTFSTWEDQKSLIEIADNEEQPSPEDYEVVVTGLYTSLADIDNSGRTTEMLEVMESSLKKMNLQNTDLYKEINSWLDARRSASNNLTGALEQYNQAIGINSRNPATLFERARIYTRLGDYKSALEDYEQVVSIAPISDTEPTPAPTSTSLIVLGISSSTPALNVSTPEITPNETLQSTLAIQLTITPVSTVPLTATTETLPPTVTPTYPGTLIQLPIQPRFLTRGQRISAVKNDIGQNTDLNSFYLATRPENYPNLATSVPILTVTPTDTLLPGGVTSSHAPTPLACSAKLTGLQNANCRIGPSKIYEPPYGTLLQGQTVSILGVNEQRTWFLVEHPQSFRNPCWVSNGPAVEVQGDLSCVQVIAVPPSNEPTWTGAWTHINPGPGVVGSGQTFVPSDSNLMTVDVSILTGNPGRGDDTITLKILSADQQVLGTSSQFVADGFDGWLQFQFPGAGLMVTPGDTFIIALADTGKTTFGWRYAGDTYPNGHAIMLGTDVPSYDFFFRINQSIKPTDTQTSPGSFSLSTPTPGIGTNMISEKDGMTLVYVPAGEFPMGSDAGADDEKPVHTVHLDAFWIDRTEVTNKMYALCVNAGVCKTPTNTRSSTHSSYYGNPEYENYPVIYVDWSMAKTYCEWASRRLPTEAEWEKAARGADGHAYPWGNDMPNNNLLNYNSVVGDTTEVGKYPNGASPYGALDMAGNVWEWVADWYDANYYTTLGNTASNPQGPPSGRYHVLRGGSWFYSNDLVRSASRGGNFPAYAPTSIGFRCAVSATP